VTWRKTTLRDGSLVAEEFVGGSTVRVTYPNGSVIVGKLTVNSVVRSGGGITMVRITTPHSGDTYMDVADADVEVWVASALDGPREVLTAVVEEAWDRALVLGASPLDTVVNALLAAGYGPTEPLDPEEN
jgi:hypothetical protein